MRTRYTYLGDSTIEVVVDGEEIAVNVLPAERPIPEWATATLEETAPDCGDAVPCSEEPIAPAAPLVLAAAPPPPGVSRLKAANIRGMWAGIFGVTGSAASEGISYAISNLTAVHLPPGLGLLIGAGLTGAFTFAQYWTKKYAKPDGTW